MQDFRNLDVWQRARKLTKRIYEMTADFAETEVFGLRSQMRRASVSICSNIAEGCGRRGDREFRKFLDIAMGSACELEVATRATPAESGERIVESQELRAES